MKKFLVVLLILAVAGGAFAQLTFNGNVRGGLGIQFTDVKDSNPLLRQYSTREDFNTRFELTGAYTHADGNAGFNARLRFMNPYHGDAYAFAGVVFNRAEAWFKMLDGMVEIRGGYVDNEGVFGTGGGVGTALGSNVGGLGMQFNVAPMDGLRLRAVVAAAPGNAAANLLTVSGLELWKASYRFGAEYSLPNLVTVVVLFQNTNKVTNLGAGFKILALKDMGITMLNIDAAFNDLQKDSGRMTIQIGQRVEYAAGDLSLGIRFQQQLRLFDGTTPPSYAPDLNFTGFVQYVLNGTIVPRLDVGFNVGTNASGNLRIAGQDVVNRGGFTKDAMSLGIAPSVQFRFPNSSHHIDLAYSLKVDLSSGNAKPASTAPTMLNWVGLNYGVTF